MKSSVPIATQACQNHRQAANETPQKGAIMEHEQKRHEKHEEGRKEKQAEERQSEQRFSLPGPTIRPLWFLALGLVLTLTALFIWWRVY